MRPEIKVTLVSEITQEIWNGPFNVVDEEDRNTLQRQKRHGGRGPATYNNIETLFNLVFISATARNAVSSKMCGRTRNKRPGNYYLMTLTHGVPNRNSIAIDMWTTTLLFSAMRAAPIKNSPKYCHYTKHTENVKQTIAKYIFKIFYSLLPPRSPISRIKYSILSNYKRMFIYVHATTRSIIVNAPDDVVAVCTTRLWSTARKFAVSLPTDV